MTNDSSPIRHIEDSPLPGNSSIRQQRMRMLTAISALLIIYLIGEYSGLLQGAAVNWWSDLFWTLASLAAGWRSVVTAKNRFLAHERIAWNLFGLASLSWFVGMMIWDYYEIFGGDLIPFPSIGDWFYLGYPVFFSAGVFFYRAQTPTRLYNMIQAANLGIIISTIIVLCYILLTPALTQSDSATDYKLIALSHPILNIACLVFALYCYWFYMWQENLPSFRLMLASLCIFAITDTLYAFQLLGHSYGATSYLNIYWLIALALHYWAAFEQDAVKQLPAHEITSGGKPRSQKYEAIMPALCFFSVVAFSLYYRKHLDENAFTVMAGAAIAFTFFLTMREWYTNNLEISLNTEIQDTSARLANAHKIGRIGSWEMNLVTNEVWWSSEVYNIFGVSRTDFKPSFNAFLKMIHPADQPKVNNVFSESILNREPYKCECRLLMPDGAVRHLAAHGETVYDDQGHPLRITGIVQDISERVTMEEALRRSQKMEAIGKISGGIAHDFNNQLGIVIGFQDLLKRYTTLDEQSHDWLETSRTAAMRCVDLTRQLLSFSRDQRHDTTAVSLNDLIKTMDAMICRSVTPEIEVEYALADDLDNTEINPGEFHDVILNLVINARDAMPGNGRLRIQTSNKYIEKDDAARAANIKSGNYVQLRVTDTGVGIDEQNLDRIFEPFFTTKPEGKGTGLGMSMVYAFVTRYGGHVNVHSEPGRGTTVCLSLPSSGQSSPAAETLPDTETEADLPTGHETVLIVDDEINLQHLAEKYLTELGYRTLCAESPAQALEILNNDNDVDLLFSDIVMPGGMNGYELAKVATEQHPGLKVLLTSGYTEKPAISEDVTHFSTHLLNKPYQKPDLATRVRTVLDKTPEPR